jgi:hypothetical protein
MDFVSIPTWTNPFVFARILNREAAMIRIRHIVLMLPPAVFTPVASAAADTAAISALKEKGLTRSGRFFVIDGEKAVLDKWKATRAVVVEYTAVAGRKSEADLAAHDFAQLEQRRAGLQEDLNVLNQQIDEQAFTPSNNRPGGFAQATPLAELTSQRTMIRMNLAQITSMQKAAKADAGPDKETLDAESKKRLESAKAAVTELRESINGVIKQYNQLNADRAVNSALRALEREGLGTFKLGPSTAFKAVMKALENAERTVLAKKAAPVSRKKKRVKK